MNRPRPRARRLRTGIAVFLVVAAVLAIMVSAVALWSHSIVFDTDAYVRVVAPVAEDPAVREAARNGRARSGGRVAAG